MSSILKALKKLDVQNSPVETTGPDLSSSPESLASQPRPWLPLAAGVALGALLVAALIVWYEKPATVAAGPVSARPVVAESQSKEQTLAGPGTPTSISPSVHQVKPIPSPVVPVAVQPKVKPPESKPVSMKFDPVVTPVDLSQPRLTPTGEQAAPKKPQETSPADAAGKALLPAAATGKTSDLPTDVALFVSEIYFQESSPDNMAVVNDLPVMEGTQIEGAIVEKILADRVVFKIDDKRYDILLSSSAQ